VISGAVCAGVGTDKRKKVAIKKREAVAIRKSGRASAVFMIEDVALVRARCQARRELKPPVAPSSRFILTTTLYGTA
jgi:hypothetical protein